MKWMPPIPAGALYSKPARDLGQALPLLAYCYDQVGRDGWFEISLKDVATDMDESYQNVKRHWWALKNGPFFSEMVDQGRKGWRVRFKNGWLDWRILNARPVPTDSFSEGTKSDLEETETPAADAQGQLKDISRSNEGTKSDLENNAYGTHDSDQADLLPPPPTQPPHAQAGGGGATHQEPTETERLLLDFTPPFSASTAREFAHLPVEAVRAELKAAAAAGSGPGSLVARWRRVPPKAPVPKAAGPPQPPRIERPPDVLTPQEAARVLQQLRKKQLEAQANANNTA